MYINVLIRRGWTSRPKLKRNKSSSISNWKRTITWLIGSWLKQLYVLKPLRISPQESQRRPLHLKCKLSKLPLAREHPQLGWWVWKHLILHRFLQNGAHGYTCQLGWNVFKFTTNDALVASISQLGCSWFELSGIASPLRWETWHLGHSEWYSGVRGILVKEMKNGKKALSACVIALFFFWYAVYI